MQVLQSLFHFKCPTWELFVITRKVPARAMPQRM
jgi:hypothetical protein